jgi:uncharacterized membrane protein YhfC
MSITGNVSTLSIVFMAISFVFAFMVPIALIVFMGVKKRMNWKAMLFGALLFVVFVLILERIMHVLVLGTAPTKSAIYKNPVFYMLYGGFAAGIFEETARLLCFKSILKVGENENIHTGISYGLGHGGIEAILIGGLASIGNLVSSVMLNAGMLKSSASAMTEQQLDAFNNGMNALVNTQSYIFLITGVERIVALSLQIALSLFVFKAVKEKKWIYFVYAILIHASIDMVAVLFQRGIFKNIFLMEGIILLATVLVAIVAFKINRKKHVQEQTIEV